MESSKPFLVKNILEIHDETPDVEQNDIKSETEDTETDQEVLEKVEEEKETAQDSTGSQVNRRKVRRCFRAEQLEYLERCFMEAIYPEASMRKRIAQELKVSNDRVQVWFQNRRAKARKQWKQQYCTSVATASRSSPTSIPKPPLASGLHLRFASPVYQYGQLRRDFHLHRYDRRNTMVPFPPFDGQRTQGPPPIPLCSCCPMPRSFAHFKPYEPRLSHSPTTPSGHRLCQCLPVRPRPTCMP
ncbi:short stature homeobox protein 2-like [Rhopilema esculentum]|uniref:short stature homeobox protein 2-like n=1 Tax=Rhopilema esculentum TaxID=499914 RepID=UPI0031D366BF